MHGSARAWLVGKLQLATLDTLPKNSRNTLLVSDCRCRLGADTGDTAADGDQLPPGSPRGAAHGLPARSSSSPCSRCRALSGGSCRCRRVISPGQIPWPGEMLTGAATRCMPSLPVTSRQARSRRSASIRSTCSGWIASRRSFRQWPANAGVTRPAAVSAAVRGTAAATSMTCARRSPGWRTCLPAAARPSARGGAGWPAPGRPGRQRPGCRRTGPIVGILRAGVL